MIFSLPQFPPLCVCLFIFHLKFSLFAPYILNIHKKKTREEEGEEEEEEEEGIRFSFSFWRS